MSSSNNVYPFIQYEDPEYIIFEHVIHDKSIRYIPFHSLMVIIKINDIFCFQT